MDPVLYVVDGGVATVTLNRPHARNAIDTPLAAGLAEALERAETDDDVHVVLFTGADPAFCAGLDLKEFTRTRRPPPRSSDAILGVAELSKPTIGAINGPVMTGGLEFALGLDVLVASERATFADTHASVGILPGGGMTARLPRAVGRRLAMDMSYTGRVLTAAEALAAGLVSRVVQHEELLGTVTAMATGIAQRQPRVMRELKQLYRVSRDVTLAESLAHEVAERDRRRAAGAALVPGTDRARFT
ncbi:enoyl-CoA hydratase [Cryptosporangium sp. NPDC051539]|uniref:enoyl-CoA hydratase n=1 Tax=Cryptosporangium sp. NPDC051539 TaxID=3363962 RepID=UPI003794C184